MSVWEVKLPRFEGPLDLLLFLVTRKEYDIMDLPMAEITESYLNVVESIGIDNLEDAGDYLLMAATLISIKARMLLPRSEEEESEEFEDPRKELVNRLLIYQSVKEEAERFAVLEDEMRERNELGRSPIPVDVEPAPFELLYPMTVYDLTRVMEELLSRPETEYTHQVELFRVTVEERIRWVLEILTRCDRFGLLKHLSGESDRIIWIASFLAILELSKRSKVCIEQNMPFSEVYIKRSESIELEAA